MKRQTNPPIATKTGLSYWEKGLVLVNLLLSINGIIYMVVMFNFLRWGGGRYDMGYKRIGVSANVYASKNFFAYNVPIMFLGSFSVFISCAGFILGFCVKKKHKTELAIYNGLVAFLFVSHLILLIYTLAWWPNLEKNYHGSLQETVHTINEQRIEYLETECDYMRELSQEFSCCGDESSSSFLTKWKNEDEDDIDDDDDESGWEEHAHLCCDIFVNTNSTVNSIAPGCFQLSLDRIKAYHIWLFVTPSGFSLACELFLAIYSYIIIRKRFTSIVHRA
jgi:hypothetical protein